MENQVFQTRDQAQAALAQYLESSAPVFASDFDLEAITDRVFTYSVLDGAYVQSVFGASFWTIVHRFSLTNGKA